MRSQAAADGTDGSQTVMLRAELASANAQLQMSNQAVSDEREVTAMLEAKVAPRIFPLYSVDRVTSAKL